jgi:steroid delta-isomerase-like uncharacterized protein
VSAEQNTALACEAIGIWSTGEVDAADEIYGFDDVNHHHDPNDPRDLRGIEAMKQFVREFHEGLPDFRESIDHQFAEGDMVATRFTSTGTHRGTSMGLEPTDRELTWTGISIDRIADGTIVETRTNWDTMGMLQQLSALSQTSQA